jgi:hypothetical protein
MANAITIDSKREVRNSILRQGLFGLPTVRCMITSIAARSDMAHTACQFKS